MLPNGLEIETVAPTVGPKRFIRPSTKGDPLPLDLDWGLVPVANDSLYTLFSPYTLRNAFLGQNRDGTPISKTDNTSNAVIDLAVLPNGLNIETKNKFMIKF